MTTETITLKKYAGKRGEATFRPMTLDEAKSLSYGQHVWFRAMQGDAREAKVNGQPKTWKRDTSRVLVSLKYGLYEYATFSESELDRLLVETA